MKDFVLWMFFILINVFAIVSAEMVVKGFFKKDRQMIIIAGWVALFSLYLSVKFMSMFL